ncbi:MAG: 3'-5' exonuclease [Bacteriovoracaceae bacterium]
MTSNSKDSVRYILGIDLEGVHENLIENGLNLKTDRIIEIGAVLWDAEENQPVKIYSELINEPDRLRINEELQELTGISEQSLKRWGTKSNQFDKVFQELDSLIEHADAFMAHNGHNYDLPMLSGFYERNQRTLKEMTWLDTSLHVEYPNKIQGRSMMALEHQHGFINPFPHRAVTDVLSMFKIAAKYDMQRMNKLANSPIVQLIAVLDAPNWKNAKEVKEFNKIKNRIAKSKFRWNAENKKWIREVPKLLLDEDKIKFDFDFYIKEL